MPDATTSIFVRKILSLLLDKYEKSSASPPRASISPKDVFPDYASNYRSIHELMEFVGAVKLLTEKGFVTCVKGKSDTDMKAIRLATDNVDAAYDFMGREKQSDKAAAYLALIKNTTARSHPAIDAYCREQEDLIQRGCKPDCAQSEFRAFIEVLKAVLENNEEIFEREFSIRMFARDALKMLLPANVSKSKYFTQAYRPKVCTVLSKHYRFPDDFSWEDAESKTEKEHILLSFFRIVPNRTIVFVKGDGILEFNNGDRIVTHAGEETPVLSDKMTHLVAATVAGDTVMTVENETSFRRITGKGFYIYIGGYHKQGQEVLIQRISENGKPFRWLHFGDLDPWGFAILDSLRRRTGLDFKPWMMSEKVYLSEQYADARIELNTADISKARKMQKDGVFPGEMRLFLEHGYKFEQEAIEVPVEQ